ncbi:hypothetical protein Bca4012_000744 [Brassica carinata]
MTNPQLLFTELKAGQSSNRCHKGFVFFWEAHDVKKGDEPMGVDIVFIEEKSSRLIALIRIHGLNTLHRKGAVYGLSDFDLFVQTLPLVILQKEIIFSKLVSGLHMKARFSLETFLGLIATSSRDLLDSFIL